MGHTYPLLGQLKYALARLVTRLHRTRLQRKRFFWQMLTQHLMIVPSSGVWNTPALKWLGVSRGLIGRHNLAKVISPGKGLIDVPPVVAAPTVRCPTDAKTSPLCLQKK